jgi:uncharacterized protein
MAKPATTLYDLSVPTFLQTARAVRGFLDRATRHCAETGADLEDVVKARLFPDMAPFHFQIEALTHHAVWGMEAAKTGVFAPCGATIKVRDSDNQDENAPGVV